MEKVQHKHAVEYIDTAVTDWTSEVRLADQHMLLLPVNVPAS